MRNKLKTISCLMLAVLCMASFSVTAFASGGDEAAATPDIETVNDTATETETETSPADDTAEDFEIPYSYTIDGDGNLVITIDGVTEPAESTTIGTVTTNGGRLNLRTGAGMSYEIIDQLRNGEEVTVIGSEGDWYEVIVPEKKGYVHGDYLELIEKAEQNSELDLAMLIHLMGMMFDGFEGFGDFESILGGLFGTDTETENGKPPFAFTPDGNMTLIDDFLQIEVPGDEETEQVEKQFITVQSKNGNTFYIVIDRNGETENVYFLNLVDEADLMALMEGEETEPIIPTCTCTDKCVVGSINTNCEICHSNMSECTGKEAVTEPEPTEPVEEPTEEPKSTNFLPIIIVLIVGAGGFAVYWFKFRKPKDKTNGSTDLDDYDFGQDDDDYDEETELDDADVMAEVESEDDES